MRRLFRMGGESRQSKKIEKILEKAKDSYENEDYETAFNQFSQAASMQSPEAQYWLGMCYLNAHGVLFNLREAALWHETAATAGWVDSAYMLALLYMRGIPEAQEITGQNIFEPLPEENYDNLQPDLDKSRYWAKQAAEQGLPEAQALYAYLLSSETKDPEIVSEALSWYDKAIAQDSAQGYMGKGLLLLRLGENDNDYAEAARFLEVAAERDMATALYKLGVMYQSGRGVPLDTRRAAELYKKAAENGVRSAQALYGVALKNGQGVEQNFIQAETWLRKAALAGDIEAAVVLADMNGQGNDDIPPNYVEAARWYVVAAENGHVTATRSLGLLYLRGMGLPQSTNKAIDLLSFAAKKGDVIATVTLGDMAIQLSDSNLQIDDVIKEYLIPGAEQGIQPIMFNLAVALLKSNTLNPDAEKEKQAREWLRKSCPEVMQARYWYGRMLLEGAGGEQKSDEAYAWISSAAEEGIADAQILWAHILLEGKTNKGQALAEEALKFYQMAADQGSVPAMFSLGAIYGGGNHLEPNREKAQIWFRKAAEKGHSKAQLMLGRYLAQGLAGQQDAKQARYWFEMALNAGEKEAQNDLKKLENPNFIPELKESETAQRMPEKQTQELPISEEIIQEKSTDKVEVAPGLFFVKKK
ncbi:TPR repeat (TPR) (PDB:1KLX) [Commensalibacter communis]|uniref:tetratricopeptide repeat protein n=1 Tax=Commensalibacter communis TaxID=2972786 RepID=UPI0022FFA5B6|nr:tetratricopeptide repeat protein [Commensalibacter communis]CAI3954963.1 TPR repeat (TPR) (PDB:1KLX) [Commensalibacter communis]